MNKMKTLGVLTLMLVLLLSTVSARASEAAAPDGPQAPLAPARPFHIRLPLVVGVATPSFGVSVGASPAEAAPGDTVTLASGLKNEGAAHIDVDVTVTVVDANGQERYRQAWSGQHIDPGQVNQLSGQYALAVSACEGQYTAGIEIKRTATGEVLYANPAQASFKVRKLPYVLSVSGSAGRSAPTNLEGQTVAGNIHVFVSPEAGAVQARFYLDNPQASGTPHQTEANPPFDFAGGSAAAANAFDTTTVANGAHTITAAIDLASGGTARVTSSFVVNNASAPRPGASAIYWGANMEGVPGDMSRLSAWERDVTGKAVSIVHWGHFWNLNGGYRQWSNTAVNNARSHGSIPMLSWTPEGGDNSRWQLIKIINGTHDAYIRQFATDAKNWGHPFFLRIMHEMNGSWGYPWQETQNGNKRGEFVQAWRHIVDIFRQVGAQNASYVWCPNIDYPNSPNPSFQSLYPGDSYVDWTCLDGYNWGSNRSSGWESFDKVYNYSYNEILKFAPSKPMMIGEFGSVEQGAPAGGSKASWFTDALSKQIPENYKQVRAAVYFDWAFDGVDWRITTSASARDAFRRAIASPYYAPNQYGSISGKIAVP